jgi:hypothetical protein
VLRFSPKPISPRADLHPTKQDERAKREREKARWTSVMDENAKLKTQVGFRIDRVYMLFTIWRIQRQRN